MFCIQQKNSQQFVTTALYVAYQLLKAKNLKTKDLCDQPVPP